MITTRVARFAAETGWVALALPVWADLFKGLFRVPRDVRLHWQSQCHATVTFQSERHHAQETVW